jgi:integrase
MAGRQARTITSAQLDVLLAHVRGRKDYLRSRAIVLLSARAGLRAAEIAQLEWAMVLDPTGKVSHTIEVEDRIAKKKHGRRIPMHADISHSSLQLDVPMKAGAILDKWPDLKDKPKRRLFEPTDGELARLLAQPMPENLRRWLLNSMATLARPTAVAQLTPAQRDRREGLVSLNTEGRRQNKKFRPTVREPKVMTKWLNEWERGTNGSPIDSNQSYCSYTNRSSIHTVLRRACEPEKADLPRMALYSIRHRGTTVLRAAKVPKEQIDYQLGHVQQGARTTQDYGQYEAAYLAEAAAALDAWITRVLKLSQKLTAKARVAA